MRFITKWCFVQVHGDIKSHVHSDRLLSRVRKDIQWLIRPCQKRNVGISFESLCANTVIQNFWILRLNPVRFFLLKMYLFSKIKLKYFCGWKDKVHTWGQGLYVPTQSYNEAQCGIFRDKTCGWAMPEKSFNMLLIASNVEISFCMSVTFPQFLNNSLNATARSLKEYKLVHWWEFHYPSPLKLQCYVMIQSSSRIWLKDVSWSLLVQSVLLISF